MAKLKTRCGWAEGSDELYITYHDEEWGVPLHDDGRMFEMLTLEGAQAGLSWATILSKRENYRRAFSNFEVEKVARFSEAKVKRLLQDPGIVRNRLKVASTVSNARAFLQVQKAFGSFDDYIWRFVDGNPIQNRFREMKDVPASTPLSEAISKDLKRRGFRFVGPTIVYALMQSIGMVNDHVIGCFRHEEVSGIGDW
jgi:DNA-3-methyladenine glycosylase I